MHQLISILLLVLCHFASIANGVEVVAFQEAAVQDIVLGAQCSKYHSQVQAIIDEEFGGPNRRLDEVDQDCVDFCHINFEHQPEYCFKWTNRHTECPDTRRRTLEADGGRKLTQEEHDQCVGLQHKILSGLLRVFEPEHGIEDECKLFFATGWDTDCFT